MSGYIRISTPPFASLECVSSTSLLYANGLHGIRHGNVTKAQLQPHD
jgi:hypothetical protein